MKLVKKIIVSQFGTEVATKLIGQNSSSTARSRVFERHCSKMPKG